MVLQKINKQIIYQKMILITGAAFLSLALSCGGTKVLPAPVVSAFRAEPILIDVGEQAKLIGTFSGGEGVLQPAIGPVFSGETTLVQPVETTTYTLTVTNVEASPSSTMATATVTVKPGLLVKVDGLPEGVAGAVTVNGPDGYRAQFGNTTPLRSLKPGYYTIQAAPVTLGNITYHPHQPTQELTVANTGIQATVSYPAPSLRFELPGKVPLEFLLIPAGSFVMGTDDTAIDFAQPAHGVSFATAFYMAKYPTTMAQWSAILGDGWSRSRDLERVDPDFPIDEITWWEILLDYLPNLKAKVPGYKFRLPSEAEWEYALRAGTTTRFFWGDTLLPQVNDYAWTWNTFDFRYHKVGEKQPNPWGLQDMYSIPQVLMDWQHLTYVGAPTDGSAWTEDFISTGANWRMARGGNWGMQTTPELIRYWDPRERFVCEAGTTGTYGFRMALSIPLSSGATK